MTMSFMSACKEYFGLRDGQSSMDFGREVFKLTNEDRKEISEGLTKMGMDIDPTTIEKKIPAAP